MLVKSKQMVEVIQTLTPSRDRRVCSLCNSQIEEFHSKVTATNRSIATGSYLCEGCLFLLWPEKGQLLNCPRQQLMSNPWPKPKWAKSQQIGPRGEIMNVCKCGAHHPAPEWVKRHDPDGKFKMDQHVCCMLGCCKRKDRPRLRKKRARRI